jgi:hypothetical protein
MASRLNLQTELENLLGSRNVYFQPPADVLMKYDAIRYSRKIIQNRFANNSVYNQRDCYELVVIYKDPDSDLPRKISRLPLCSFDRHYTANNLNHDVFTIYY